MKSILQILLSGLSGIILLGCQPQDILKSDSLETSDTLKIPKDSISPDTTIQPEDTLTLPNDTVFIPNDNDSSLAISSLTATPPVVKAAQTSVIECKTVNARGTIKYTWSSSGDVGYILPADSICIFASPACHYGPSSVTVIVEDESGAYASKTVHIN